MSQTDPRAEHGYVLDLLTEIGKAYATPGCDPAKVLAKALADAERRGMERAAGICEAEALIDDERGYYGKEMAKAIRLKADEIN